MSMDVDIALITALYPQAHLVKRISTGGSKVVEFVVCDGANHDAALGALSLKEDRAWRYACERIELSMQPEVSSA